MFYKIKQICNKTFINIINGPKKFINKYKPKNIICNINLKQSNGELYKNIGCDFIKRTKFNYFYFKTNENILYYFKQVKKLIKSYDDNLSEQDNMFNNKYNRIWDCGNLILKWKKGDINDRKQANERKHGNNNST